MQIMYSLISSWTKCVYNQVGFVYAININNKYFLVSLCMHIQCVYFLLLKLYCSAFVL